MTCLHRFKAHLRLPVLYCEHCGETRALETLTAQSRTGRRQKPAPQAMLPFDAPPAVGSRSFMDPGTPASAADLAQLEREFLVSTGPISQAASINELAERLNFRRELGDPEGTYRPEETSAVERMTPRIE
ncbi:MAG: hypothetical protein KGL39_32610 [Patescibacteria group bacterium]|nr:hypothetical protein [Patescibacteria group bacterium]